MPHFLAWAAALLLIPGFRVFDRLWGADGTKRDAKLLALCLLALGFLAAEAAGAGVVLVAILGRSKSFKGGASAPTTDRERRAALTRALMPLPGYLAVALLATQRVLPVVLAFLLFTLAAAWQTHLAYWYGERLIDARLRGVAIDPRDNEHVERARGTGTGLALAAWILSLGAVWPIGR